MTDIDNPFADITEAADPDNPFAETVTPEPESSNPLVNLGKGLYKGTVYGIPEQLGKAAQFLGVGGQTAKDIAKWGEEGIGKEEKGVVQQTGEMIPESIGVPIVSQVVGQTLISTGNPYAAAAGMAIKIGGRFITPALFGLAQAQTTKETAEEAGKEPGFWPLVTGGIEWAGETAANIALGRILGPFATIGKVAKTAIAKMSVTGAMKGTIGAYLKELALVTAPTEILTEMGQNYGEALAEKWSGIRPEAQPGAEAASAIAPTALMTALLGPFGRIAQRHVVNKQASILSEPINPQDPNANELMAMRMKVAQEMTKVIPEENAELRDQWVAYASQKIQNNLPIDIAAPLDSLSMQIETQMDELPEEKKVVEQSEVTPPSVALEEPIPPITPETAQITPETAPAVTSTETLPETRVETAPEEEIAPRPGDKTFIENKIRQLGTIEAVNKFYSGNDVVSDYARTMAPKILGVEKPKLSYEDFIKKYQDAFSLSMKYTPDQVGSRTGTDEMARLADEYPDYLTRFEGENVGGYRSRGLEDAVNMRKEEPGGSLANYDAQSTKEWLRGQTPPADGNLTLYRATPDGAEIKPGDYVTNSRQYAQDHITNNLGGKGKITSIKGTLDDLYPADGPGEFWYAPKSIVQPVEKVGSNRWANDLAALDREVIEQKDQIIRWSRNQAEADGWLDKWTPAKAIDEHYGKYVRGLGSASGKPLKKGETWRGRLTAMVERTPGATPGGETDPLWYQGQRATKTGAFEDRTDAFFTKDPTEAEWYAGGLSINPEDRISGGRVIAVRQSELEKRLGRSVKGEEIISDVYPTAMKESIPVDSIIKTDIPALSEKTKLRNPITGTPLKSPELKPASVAAPEPVSGYYPNLEKKKQREAEKAKQTEGKGTAAVRAKIVEKKAKVLIPEQIAKKKALMSIPVNQAVDFITKNGYLNIENVKALSKQDAIRLNRRFFNRAPFGKMGSIARKDGKLGLDEVAAEFPQYFGTEQKNPDEHLLDILLDRGIVKSIEGKTDAELGAAEYEHYINKHGITGEDALDALSGEDQERIEGISLDEIAGEAGLTEEERRLAAADAGEFLDAVAKPSTYPRKEDWIGKEETAELPPPISQIFNLVPTETEIGTLQPQDRGPKTAGMFEETKAGDIHPDDTWEGYGEALDNTVRQTWKTKLEGFVNELQRTLQENRDKQTSGDTSYIGGDEVSILRRLRDRRLFDEEVRGANQRNDRQRWQGVDISPAFADTPEFKLGERHFASLGYQTVPVTKLPWGMAVNPNTKIVFMGEMSGDSFAYFMSHETSHILSAQGNPSVLAIKDAIDLANSSIVEQRAGRDWDDDYTRDEFTASIVGGVVGNESMLKGNQTENLKSAREAVFSATQAGEGGTKYGNITPAKPPSTTQPASWDSPSPTPMSNFIYTFIDRQVDLRNVVRAIKKVTGDIKDIINPDLRERLYAGTVAEKTKQYLEREFAPLIQEMIQRKVNITDFEHYLWNRTAEETNEYIASLGGDHLQDGGSGILTAEAKKYLVSLDPKTKATYDKLAARTDKMLAINRDLVVSYVLESKDTVDKWTNAYKNYAPLFREDVESGIGTGEGFSVTGPVSRKRKGSVRPVVDILAHIAEQRERIIARGEKNRISTALYGLAKENPNPTFWKLATPNVVERLSVETGEMVKVIDMSYLNRDNVVMSRQLDPKTKKIIQRGVEFTKNPSAERMAKALKNIDMDTLGKILGISAKVTRFIASMNTQYNPVFGVVNFVRDLQFAMLSLSSTPLAGKQKQIWSNTFPALRAIYTDIRSKNKAAVSNNPWVALWEDFREHGGPTGYRDLFRTTKDRAEAIKKEMTLAGPQKLSGKAVIPLYRAIKGWLSDYNTAMENAVRLAAYKTGIDSGMSKDQAAVLAKSLTVDFNRKGQIAIQAGSLYAFFNANAQGSARMIETLMGPTGTKIIAGGITLGALQAMMLAAAGFGDDEPPEFVRERSLIIPIGGKSYVTIPMPLGFHILPNIGRITAEFALGGFKSPMKKMVDLTGVIVESFNPMGSSGLSIQTITPTIIDPFTALAENKDWTGKEIYRENFSPLNPTPGFTRTKDTATWFSKKLSWAFNRMSGGTEYKPGLFSPTADQIDYLFGQAAGGIGREATKVQQAVQSITGGEELPPYKIPLVGRFYGSSEGQSNEATKFYRNLKILNAHELEIKGRQKAREPIGDYLKENPEARYWAMANRFETNISKLTDRKRRMVEKNASKDSIRNMNNLIAAQMKKMNDIVARAEGR